MVANELKNLFSLATVYRCEQKLHNAHKSKMIRKNKLMQELINNNFNKTLRCAINENFNCCPRFNKCISVEWNGIVDVN